MELLNVLQMYNIHGLFNYVIGLGAYYKDNQSGTYRSCFTEDIMPDFSDDQSCNTFAEYLLENYMAFDSNITPDIWAGIPPEEKRLIIISRSL